MAIELHHLQPSHDDELSRLKARIADLEKINHEFEEERRWRKFPDEKPNCGEEVIVSDVASKQFIVSFSYDMKWISFGKIHTCESMYVKHWMPFGNMHTCESKYVKYWMPLPSAPKEEK